MGHNFLGLLDYVNIISKGILRNKELLEKKIPLLFTPTHYEESVISPLGMYPMECLPIKFYNTHLLA